MPSRRSVLTSRSTPCLVRTNRIVRPVAGGDLGDDARLRGGVDDEQVVLHRLDLRGGRGDRAGHRVVQVAADQRGDVAVERGGEQQPLPVGRGEVEDRADLGQEPHVGHPVGLVDRGDRRPAERSQVRWLVWSVSRPGVATSRSIPRCSSAAWRLNDMPPTTEVTVRPSAFAYGASGVDDLLRELAGGHEDQAAGPAGLGPAAGEPGQHREAEGQRLARAGLAAAEQVAPGEGRRAAWRPGSGTAAVKPPAVQRAQRRARAGRARRRWASRTPGRSRAPRRASPWRDGAGAPGPRETAGASGVARRPRDGAATRRSPSAGHGERSGEDKKYLRDVARRAKRCSAEMAAAEDHRDEPGRAVAP